MRVYVLMLKQDDPKKCTAAKMARFGLARPVRRMPKNFAVLHPYADTILLPSDGNVPGVCAVDCSWRLAPEQFAGPVPGHARRLPPLLAGNPLNYSKIGMLSTAEAVSAALHIMGFSRDAEVIMGKFRWGHTFLELNASLLDEYSRASTAGDIRDIAKSYGLARS